MGRGRGKGKKLTVTTHEDPGSGGEEVIPAYKRRGRPTKPLKEDIHEEDDEKIDEEEEGDDVKPTIPSKEMKGLTVNGKKRKRNQQVKENSDLVSEENGAGTRAKAEEATRPNGFRQNGSRRKSKPRRAAEAGVECK